MTTFNKSLTDFRNIVCDPKCLKCSFQDSEFPTASSVPAWLSPRITWLGRVISVESVSVFNLTMTGGDRLVLQCFAVVYYTKAKPVTPQFPITHCSETIPNWSTSWRGHRHRTSVATASVSHVYHVHFFVHGDFAGVQWLRVVNLRIAFFFLLFFQFQSSVSLGEVRLRQLPLASYSHTTTD